jgi:hypothetical protein
MPPQIKNLPSKSNEITVECEITLEKETPLKTQGNANKSNIEIPGNPESVSENLKTYKNSDMTAYFYPEKSGILKGGSGRELVPGYSVGCLVKYHKELYGKIVQIYGTGIEDFEKRHFRVDDSGYGNGKDEFLIDFYAGTGEQYKEFLSEKQLKQGRFKGLTVVVIGEWDGKKEIIY